MKLFFVGETLSISTTAEEQNLIMASRAGRRAASGRRNGNGGHSWERKLLTKLIKDENAVFAPRDTHVFLRGMSSFSSKPELLMLITDDRNCGELRLHECLSMISGPTCVDRILGLMLSNILVEDTSRPLHKARRTMAVTMIFNSPGLMQFLAEEWVVCIDQAEVNTVSLICQLLMDASLSLVEARSSDDVKSIATGIRKCSKVDTNLTHRLCAILQLDNPQKSKNIKVKRKEKSIPGVVCWGADTEPPGERHDNDHLNFRNISLVPTKDELAFKGRPWLPLESGENNFIEDPSQRLLDRNFRLLRQDAIGAMKENLADPRAFKVWKNARIIGASCKDVSNPRGTAPLHFFVQVDVPQEGRVINWNRQRSFPRDGLVALRNGDHHIMATIFIRKCDQDNQWLLNKGGPIIGVIFHHDDEISNAFSDISGNKDTNETYKARVEELSNITDPNEKQIIQDEVVMMRKIFKSYDLIEASDSFFAYRPVLESIQMMMSVPLAEELVHIQKHPKPPSYLPRTVILPSDFNKLEANIENWSHSSIMEKTTLDESQSKALHMALTNRVALIQGPPGEKM